MKKYIEILKKTKLFARIGDGDIEAMLGCLGATVRSFKKGEYIFHEGEKIQFITVLLEGCILVQRDDYWGNRSIINRICVGEMFGEAYATPGSGELLNDVVAIEDSTVMFFDVLRILTVCPSACRFHSMTVHNLVCAISEKNRSLVAKLGYMSSRSTRGKLLAYLSDEAKKQHSSSFEIPFNRQQLADFLSVDRSAMSNELCKLRDDGLLVFEKNYFKLL